RVAAVAIGELDEARARVLQLGRPRRARAHLALHEAQHLAIDGGGRAGQERRGGHVPTLPQTPPCGGEWQSGGRRPITIQGKRASIAAVVLLAGGTARAGVMGGFAGHDTAYLVGADRVCAPLAVENGAAKGTPSCHKAASDELAQLSIKPPKVERGAKATFAATASGGTLTVTRVDGGASVVTWTSVDPISKVVDVYADADRGLVAVEIMVRRAGRDQADVIGFQVGGAGASTAPAE